MSASTVYDPVEVEAYRGRSDVECFSCGRVTCAAAASTFYGPAGSVTACPSEGCIVAADEEVRPWNPWEPNWTFDDDDGTAARCDVPPVDADVTPPEPALATP